MPVATEHAFEPRAGAKRVILMRILGARGSADDVPYVQAVNRVRRELRIRQPRHHWEHIDGAPCTRGDRAGRYPAGKTQDAGATRASIKAGVLGLAERSLTR